MTFLIKLATVHITGEASLGRKEKVLTDQFDKRITSRERRKSRQFSPSVRFIVEQPSIHIMTIETKMITVSKKYLPAISFLTV
jgi:hypothetical protein